MNTRMRKYSFYVMLSMCLVLIGMGVPVNVSAKKVPQVNAKSYVVMDAGSGKILYKKKQNKKIYPASTAKIMTAVVALESKKAGKKVKVTNSILNQMDQDAAKAGLKAGSTYSFNAMLHMLLLPSAADAAECLAVSTYGTKAEFVKAMNEKAEELGMKKTSFDNPIGLDKGNGYYQMYSTAKNMATLARYAMEKTEFRNVVKKAGYRVPSAATKPAFRVKNTNGFYGQYKDNNADYTIIGVKTGTTKAAGNVLIAAARDEEGHEVICAYFGASTSKNLYEGVRKLLDHTFDESEAGNIELEVSPYDVRSRKSAEIINKYLEEGVITTTSAGAFKPDSYVTQKTFYSTVKKIAGLNWKATAKNNKMTLLDLAQKMYEDVPVMTEDELNEFLAEMKNPDKYPEEDQIRLAALYQSGILPHTFNYNAKKKLTKEDMVLIADALAKQESEKEPTEEPDSTTHTDAATEPTAPTEAATATEATTNTEKAA